MRNTNKDISKKWYRGAGVLLALAIAVGAHAAPKEPVPAVMDSAISDSARYVVRIERQTVTPIDVLDTLDVTIESYGHPYAACQLKFGSISRSIDIIAILKGEIIDSCEWEYFRAGRVVTKEQPGVPHTLWSVTALAKLTPDTIRPVCLGLDRSASIVRLVVSGAPNVPTGDSVAPIFFWWDDCRDNTLSDSTGNLLYVSSQVIDYFDAGLPRRSESFPTQLGAPDQCINPRKANHPRRRIEFHNGGLRFEAKIPPLRDSASSSTKTR